MLKLNFFWMHAVSLVFLLVFSHAVLAAPVEPLLVFVSVLPQANFVEKIGGDLVQVQVMVGPGQNPHTYEPTPRQMTRLAEARLYFSVGVSFENAWLPRIQQVNPSMRLVDTRKAISLQHLPMPAIGHEGHEHDHGSEWDPHIWTDPRLVMTQAKTIRDALAEVLPDQTAVLDRNLAQFERELTRLDERIRTVLAPLQNRSFMVFHPSWGYFARAYGLRQVAIEVEGKEPGPRTLARLMAKAQRDNIRVIFIQPQFSPKLAKVIAQQIGARVEIVDPLARDYQRNLLALAQKLAAAADRP